MNRLRNLLVLGVVTVLLLGLAPAALAQQVDLTYTDVTVSTPDEDLAGTIVAPAGGGSGLPGVVLVHGAGGNDREELLSTAEAFARGGVVALVHDKRSVGYSLTHRSFAQLADDALAGVRLLRERPEVDNTRVGLWGLSEGGWVAPMAANADPEVAFVITVGASGRSPLRTQNWADQNWLRRGGASDSVVHAVPWRMNRVLNDAGMYPEADHDPVPVLQQVQQPMLGIWGQLDRTCPPAESAAVFEEALGHGGNPVHGTRVFAGASHDMTLQADGFGDDGAWPPGYEETIVAWASGDHEAVLAAPRVDAEQARESVDLPPLSWYESSLAEVVVLGTLVLAFAVYCLTGLVRRLRSGSPAITLPAAALAATGLVTVVGLFAYASSVIMLKDTGPVLAGRALPWLALQLLTLMVIGAAVATALAWWRDRRTVAAGPSARLAVLLFAAVLFVPWAAAWGLLTP